jgi:hypothetical protein
VSFGTLNLYKRKECNHMYLDLLQVSSPARYSLTAQSASLTEAKTVAFCS